MKAIDLYCGIGGWSLGLQLAGIDVVAAYELWQPAIETYTANLGHAPIQADIRKLQRKDFPRQVDLVVGSPPCTEFSYSNKGGKGDLTDGLVDIAKFLEVVDWVKPRFWAMENVPRVMGILESELWSNGGPLWRYRHLFDDDDVRISVLNFDEYGLPQRRSRCIAGKVNWVALEGFKEHCNTPSLGDIVKCFERENVSDPNFRYSAPRMAISLTETEAPLAEQEVRLNRDSKQHHPIYNRMSFPESMNEPSRTITATCSRVSRESIVIRTKPKARTFRRLSLRERATIQGFPINYEFPVSGYSKAIKLVGNALPPVFAYWFGRSCLDPSGENTIALSKVPLEAISSDRPHSEISVKRSCRYSYPVLRRFTATIPNLRFGSGVRFQFSNRVLELDRPIWQMEFFYGTPKDICELPLDASLHAYLRRLKFYRELKFELDPLIDRLTILTSDLTPKMLQDRWTGRANSGTTPHELVDELGVLAHWLLEMLNLDSEAASVRMKQIIDQGGTRNLSALNGQRKKLDRYAREIVAGSLLGCEINSLLSSKTNLTQS